MFDGVDKYFPALACPTSPEKPGKPNRNLPMVNLILKNLKYDIKYGSIVKTLEGEGILRNKISAQKMAKMDIPPEDEFRLRMATFGSRSIFFNFFSIALNGTFGGSKTT